MKLLVIVCSIVMLAGCATNDHEAIKALDDEGFSDISITDRGFMFAEWQGCDKRDGNWYHAHATNPRGKPVNMLVCCGSSLSFKGCTVRSK
jgi:hypothetical protein